MAMSTENVSVALSAVAVSIARGALSLAHESWRGVDLIDATCSATGLRWYHRDDFDEIDMSASPMQRQIDALPAVRRQELLEAIATVGPQVPLLESANSSLQINGSFVYFMYQVAWYSSGYTGIKFLHGSVSFTPRWSNPAWELFFEVTAEEQEIAARVFAALSAVLKAPWLWTPSSSQDFQEGTVQLDGRVTMLLRAGRRLRRLLAALLPR